MYNPSKTNRGGSLTREQFLLEEMRIVAHLRLEGHPDEGIISLVKGENLFQYPTSTMIASRARACLNRLDALHTSDGQHEEGAAAVLDLLANGTYDQRAQANLYAMMRRYDIVAELMEVEVGERLARLDHTFTQADLNVFVERFRAEHTDAAAWSDATLVRLKATLRQCLRRVGFLEENPRSQTLRPVLPDPEVAAAIRANGDDAALVAFTGRVSA